MEAEAPAVVCGRGRGSLRLRALKARAGWRGVCVGGGGEGGVCSFQKWAGFDCLCSFTFLEYAISRMHP